MGQQKLSGENRAELIYTQAGMLLGTKVSQTNCNSDEIKNYCIQVNAATVFPRKVSAETILFEFLKLLKP